MYKTKMSHPRLINQQNASLVRSISNIEVNKAMFSISGSKAFEEDRFLTLFYQKNYQVVRGMCAISFKKFLREEN